MTVKGVDTIDHKLTGATLKAAGYSFANAYYAGGTSTIGKEITAALVKDRTAAGIRTVSNWETNGAPANTVAKGEADARAFLAQHKQVGGPSWAPCYFSIDHSINPTMMDNYFRGCVNILGVDRVGCYGEGELINHLKAHKLISLGWLAMSTAWPGGTDTSHADLHQTGRGTVAGHSVDFNTALTGYYGGWLLGEPAPNSHPSAPVVQPPEVDMQLTDPVDNGQGGTIELGVMLSRLYVRSANLGPWEKQELDTIKGMVSTLAAAQDPAKLAAALAPLLADQTVTPETVAAGMALFVQQIAAAAPQTTS